MLLLRPESGFDYEIWTLDFHVMSFAAAIFFVGEEGGLEIIMCM